MSVLTPLVPWRCRDCGEEQEPEFDACWNCGTEYDAPYVDHPVIKPLLDSYQQCEIAKERAVRDQEFERAARLQERLVEIRSQLRQAVANVDAI